LTQKFQKIREFTADHGIMELKLEAATKRYVQMHPKSQELFQTALSSLPGGNTRTTLYTAPFPISLARGETYQLFDEDGNT
jgi:glutamate-1-semialdehyde 2,1-aminomutase